MTEQEYKDMMHRPEVASRNAHLKDDEFLDMPVKKPLKYRNTPVITDYGYFHSMSEEGRWQELKELEEQGVISHLDRQVKVEVIPCVFWESKGIFLPPIFWVIDFKYFFQLKWTAEDRKSEATLKLPDYKMKRQLFLLRYPDFRYIETTKGTK